MIDFSKTWKNSIFSRLFWTFLLIITPLYILGFNIYNWGMQTVQEEITSTVNSQVSFYMDSLEMDIQRMQILQYECLNDEDLNALAVISETMDKYEQSKAILRLQQRLSAIKNSSVYIKNVMVYIPSMDITISPIYSPNKLQREEYEVLSSKSSGLNGGIIYWSDRLFISVIHPTYNPVRDREPLYVIGIELSKSGLERALEQFDNHKNSGSFLINSSYEYVIAKSESNEEDIKKMSEWLYESHKNDISGNGVINIGNKQYLAIYSKSEYLGITFCKYILSDEVFSRVKHYRIWFWIFSVVSIMVIVLHSFSTYMFIHQPLKILVESFYKIEKGELSVVIYHNHNDEFRYIYRRFNAMVKRLNTLIDQVYKQKILNQKAELKQLQSQINPHFLYNSFFILSRMIKGKEYENAMQFSRQIGGYFKFITRNAADEVTLEKEVEHARTYSWIQEMRFARRLHVEFEDLISSFKELVVPRLILQPIIENAFEHGLANKKNNGLIRVYFLYMDYGIKIFVEDNGEELSDHQLAYLKEMLTKQDDTIEYTGMLNIHRRVQLKFGEESGLLLSRSEIGGLKVEICLIWKGEEYHV